VTTIPPCDSYREFSKEHIKAIATDARPCGVMAIVFGTTPKRIREIRVQYKKDQQLKRQLNESRWA